jgi:endoglucanase
MLRIKMFKAVDVKSGLRRTWFMIFLFSVWRVRADFFIHEPPYEKMMNQTYWDTWKFRYSNVKDEWKTVNGTIYRNNQSFLIRGTNFNGIESGCRVPLGLSDKPLKFFLDFLEDYQFNSIRIPVSYEVMNDLSIPIVDSCATKDPDLFYPGMTTGAMIGLLLDKFHERNISVLFDQHSIGGVITSSPWTDTVNEDMVIAAWLNFINTYQHYPAFMGIEIKNEPHEITLTRFLDYCAKMIYNVGIHLPYYRGLYFISGIQLEGGPWGGSFDESLSTFKGFTHPSMLCAIDSYEDKYVLNPHVYGPSVRGILVANEDDSTWEESYGFISTLDDHWNISTIIPTEWGGTLVGEDYDYYSRWLEWHVNKKGFKGGGYFWTMGPFSSDTGGIFDENYNIDYNKIRFIDRLTPDITRSSLLYSPSRKN